MGCLRIDDESPDHVVNRAEEVVGTGLFSFEGLGRRAWPGAGLAVGEAGQAESKVVIDAGVIVLHRGGDCRADFDASGLLIEGVVEGAERQAD